MHPTPSQPGRQSRSLFRSGEIYAPRIWVFDDEYLYGPSFWHKRWEHDEPVALPTIDHTLHGVYAFKDERLLYEWLRENQKAPVIVGRVRLWGSVIEYERGWRAQFGRVDALITKMIDGSPVEDDEHIRRLRKNYHV